MDALHQKCLTRRRVYLLENLRPDEVMDYLIQDEIITIDEKDEILAQITRRRQAEALLNKLPHCGHRAFDVLVMSLQETSQKHLASELASLYEELCKDAGVSSSRDPNGSTQHYRRQESSGNSSNKHSGESFTNRDWLYTEMCHEMRTRIVSEKELVLISQDMPPCLAQLGILMGFPPAKVEQIQYSYPHNLPQQCTMLMVAWRNKEASDATVEKFVGLLRQARISEDCYKEVLLGESRNVVDVVV